MPKPVRPDSTPVLRLEPEKRLCPLFDPTSFPLVLPEESALVLDNFCVEHIQ